MNPLLDGVPLEILVLAEASTPSVAANDELLGVVLASSVIGIVFIWSLICQYRQAIADNRVRAIRQLEERCNQLSSQAKALLDHVHSEIRDFSPQESRQLAQLLEEHDCLEQQLKIAKEQLPTEISAHAPQLERRPTSAVEGLLFLQLLAMLSPFDRHRRDR